jgi:hypothetical protein
MKNIEHGKNNIKQKKEGDKLFVDVSADMF